MYYEPPDLEPNPCPFCDEELGNNTSCEHCRVVRTSSGTEDKLSTLKHLLGCRARWLCMTDPTGPLSPRFMEAIGLLLDLAGLPLPEAFRRQAKAAMTGEYGESRPIEKSECIRGIRAVPDDVLVGRFMAMAYTAAAAATRPYFGEVLDAKPATEGDQLWWGDDEEGVPRVWTGAEKRVTGRASSTQWGLTLRQAIEKALDHEARSAAFWLEFQREYLRPPKSLVLPEKVSFVVGIEAYTAYVGRHKSERWNNQGLGFGGAEFTVKLEDGREFFTDNNSGRGTVPPHLRKLLKSNAVFLREPDGRAMKLGETASSEA